MRTEKTVSKDTAIAEAITVAAEVKEAEVDLGIEVLPQGKDDSDYISLHAQVTEDSKTLSALMDKIELSHAQARKDVAIAAACCVLRAVLHGDVSTGNRLADLIKHGWRSNTLRDWYAHFGPFDYYVPANTTVVRCRLDRAKRKALQDMIKKDREGFVKSLLVTPFWSWRPEAEFKPLNLVEAIEKIIARADRVAAGPNASDPRNDLRGLKRLKEICADAKAGKAN